MKVIDADKILNIMQQNPNMTIEELKHCIQQQSEVASPQKALVEIWNEINALDPDEQDRLSAYHNAEQIVISSINPEYYNQFTLKKPDLGIRDSLYSVSSDGSRVQGYTILSLGYNEDNKVTYNMHADGTGISEGYYEIPVDSVDQPGSIIYSSPEGAREAYQKEMDMSQEDGMEDR